MDKDIFSFDDFIKENSYESDYSLNEVEPVKENEPDYSLNEVEPVKENESDYSLNEVEPVKENDELKLTKERIDYLISDFGLTKEDLSEINITEKEKNYYNLFRDVNENFSCDIFIEGTNPNNAEARLVIESEDWNLIFNGTIENGKCNIPIKKLDILKENLVGNIKLEIIAEGSVFVPWQDEFLVKSSKKISTLNEKLSKEIDVKVNRIR